MLYTKKYLAFFIAIAMLLEIVGGVRGSVPAKAETVSENNIENTIQVVNDNAVDSESARVLYSGVDGDLTWSIDSDGLLTISGEGDYSTTEWLEYADEIISATVIVSEITNTSYMFRGCSNLVNLDLSELDTSNVTDMSSMFSSCSSLVNLDLSELDTSKVRTMYRMFFMCYSLVNLNISEFKTSSVTDMNSMFYGCSSLTNVDVGGFDTSNVTDMSSMFFTCSKLRNVDVSGFNTSNVTSMRALFWSCESLSSVDVSGFDTSNVVDMSFMFGSCSSLINVDLSNFDASQLEEADSMFSYSGLESIDLSNFNAHKLKNLYAMFASCKNLKSVDLSGIEITSETDTDAIFEYCSNLSSIVVKCSTHCLSFPEQEGAVWINQETQEVVDCMVQSGTYLRINTSVSINSVDNFIISGIAQEVEEGVRLTNTNRNVSGGFWSVNPVDLTNKFILSFDFKMYDGYGNGSQGNGADGITVSFTQKKPGILGTGGSIAFTGNDSFGVQYDTWDNGRTDKNDDHVSIIKNNESTHVDYKELGSKQLDDGEWHSSQIIYGPSKMTVYLDDEKVCECDKSKIYDVDSAYICISAATGSFVNNHVIRNVSINNGETKVSGYTRDSLHNKKALENITFSEGYFVVENGKTIFNATATNTGKTKYYASEYEITFLDRNGKELLIGAEDCFTGYFENIDYKSGINISLELSEQCWDICDYKIKLKPLELGANYLSEYHHFLELDFREGRVDNVDGQNQFTVKVDNVYDNDSLEQAVVFKFYDKDGNWLFNVDAILPLLSAGTYTYATVLLPDDIFKIYDYVVVRKGMENQSFQFNKDLYRATYLYDRNNPSSATWESYVNSDGTSKIIMDSLDETWMKTTTGIWTWLQDQVDKIDNPANVVDQELRERDIYSAMILDMLKSSSIDSAVWDCTKNINKNSKKITSLIKKDAVTDNSLEFMAGCDFEDIEWSLLTVDEKKNFMKSFEEAYKKTNPSVSKIGDFVGCIDKVVKAGGTLEDCIVYIVSYVEIYNMSEAQKNVIYAMYKKCSENNMELKMALCECYNIISSSNLEFYTKLMNGTMSIAGREIASAVVDLYWKDVKASIMSSHPYVGMYFLAFELGTFASNGLFNTDEICEKYYCIAAMREFRELTESTYYDLEEAYAKNSTSTNAKNYLAAADIMYRSMDCDCDYSINFLKSVDGGWIAKLKTFFGDRNAEETIKSVESIRKMNEGVYISVLSNWIYGLEIDYPEEYIKYRHYLELENQTLTKLYEIACPVDVYVFDSKNNLVASVVNDIPKIYDNSMRIAVENSKKYLYFTEKCHNYIIKYVGTDEGEMDIKVTEYQDNSSTRSVEFNRVELTSETQYMSEFTNSVSGNDIYYLDAYSNEIIEPDYDSASENTITDTVKLKVVNGIASYHGRGIISGEAPKKAKLQISAVTKEDEEFVGWKLESNDTDVKALIKDVSLGATDLYIGDSDCIVTAVVKKKDADLGNNGNNEMDDDKTDSSDKDEKVKKIKLSGISKKIAVGKNIKLTATVLPSDATNKAVTWKSSNKKYATVSSIGKITVKKAGVGKTVTITATAKDGSGVKATYKIKIMKHKVTNVKLKASKKTIKAGRKVVINAMVKTNGKKANKTLKWTSSNTKYATVTSKGVVKTKKAGKGKVVTITAASTDGTNKKAKVKIKIK